MKLNFIFIAVLSLIILWTFPLIAGLDPETLTVTVLNWDGTPATPDPVSGSVLRFPYADATVNEPWVHCPQYLQVEYKSDENIWGLRIITDNVAKFGQVYPKSLNKGPDGKWEWENHPEWPTHEYRYINNQWVTGDDSVSFEGLIDDGTKYNPNYRAELAWQVYVDPVAEPGPLCEDFFGQKIWFVGGEWNDDWAYVVDRSNKWNGQPSVGGVFYPGTWNIKYEMVLTGNPTANNLAYHPVVSGSQTNPDPKPGDCNIALYLAVCFGVMENGEYVRLIPAGDYDTRLVLELIHE